MGNKGEDCSHDPITSNKKRFSSINMQSDNIFQVNLQLSTSKLPNIIGITTTVSTVFATKQ